MSYSDLPPGYNMSSGFPSGAQQADLAAALPYMNLMPSSPMAFPSTLKLDKFCLSRAALLACTWEL